MGRHDRSVIVYADVEIWQNQVDLLDQHVDILQRGAVEDNHAFYVREFGNELDELFNRLLASPDLFQRYDLAFFQNKQRLDAEHPAEECLRLAHPSSMFEIVERLDKEGDIDARNQPADKAH